MSILTQKRCSKCNREKLLIQFSKNKRNKDGYDFWCKQCQREKNLKYYADHPEKRLEKNRKHQAANSRTAREWRVAHPEQVRANNHEYYAANQEKRREYNREWAIANQEKKREYIHEWVAANREKKREHSRNRRALKKGCGGKITSAEWQALKEKYNYTCLACERREPEIKLTLDHVIPLAKPYYGPNTIENAQPLCLSCNCSKGKKHKDYR